MISFIYILNLYKHFEYCECWYKLTPKCFYMHKHMMIVIKHLPKGLDTFAIDIIIWLLRWNILVEVEVYLVDTHLYSKFDDYDACTGATIDDQIEQEVRTEKSISTQHVLIQDQALLDRLKPYLDGNTPMSEILYQLAAQIDAGCRRLSFDNDNINEGIVKGINTDNGSAFTMAGDDNSVTSSSTSGAIPMFSVNAEDVLALVARSNSRIIINMRPAGL